MEVNDSTGHLLDKPHLFRAVGSAVRAEKVVEPDLRLFRKRDGLPVFHGVPGILALLLTVHKAVAEASNLILLEERKDGGIIRTPCAGHPF